MTAERLPHDPTEFQTLGAAICGPRWQRALARRLSLNERTVRRYAAGEIPVPEPTMMLLRLWAGATTTPPQAQQ